MWHLDASACRDVVVTAHALVDVRLLILLLAAGLVLGGRFAGHASSAERGRSVVDVVALRALRSLLYPSSAFSASPQSTTRLGSSTLRSLLSRRLQLVTSQHITCTCIASAAAAEKVTAELRGGRDRLRGSGEGEAAATAPGPHPLARLQVGARAAAPLSPLTSSAQPRLSSPLLSSPLLSSPLLSSPLLSSPLLSSPLLSSPLLSSPLLSPSPALTPSSPSSRPPLIVRN